MKEKGSTVLRKMMHGKELIVAPGTYDPMTALLAEKTGFKAIYMSGAGTSMFTLGLPDVGLITMNEMIENAARIVARVNIPVISDADTGFGNAIGVKRTIREFIQRGVAAVHIEDQIPQKRCGHVAGKICISTEEMVGKIRAAADVRAELDPEFLIIARCDFRGVAGGSLEGTIERLNQYIKAGADVGFADGILSVEELKQLCDGVKAPILYNMGGLSPILNEKELENAGVKILITSGSSIMASFHAVREYLKKLKEDVTYESKFLDETGLQWSDVFAFIGLPEIKKLEEEYLPEEIYGMRYNHSTIGFFSE